MKIAFGCDPNAESFKQEIIKYVASLGHECVDHGSEDPISANIAFDVAKRVVAGEFERGKLLYGNGLGVSIAANRVKGAYAALVNNIYQAERATLSNNANILCMGSQVTGIELAKCLAREYLAHTFDPNSRSGPKFARIAEFEREGK